MTKGVLSHNKLKKTKHFGVSVFCGNEIANRLILSGV
jgi:hypothetical protein